jgi:hypothetical protein
MAIVSTYNFIAAVTNEICLTQNTAGAGTLLFNGIGVGGGSSLTSNFYAVSPFVMPGNCDRTVSLTSTANNSAVNVTITGTFWGKIVSETRAGSNNNTVYTTQLFSTVTSVSVSAAVTGLSVGIGTTAATQPFSYDTYPSVCALGVQAVLGGTALDVQYTFQATLQDVFALNTAGSTITWNNGIFAPNPGNANPIQVVFSASTASNMAVFNNPHKYSRISFSSNHVDGTGTASFYFVEQGIR